MTWIGGTWIGGHSIIQVPESRAGLQPSHSLLRAIVGRLADLHPDQFSNKQHSIVQRLLRALRKSAAQRLIAETAAEGYDNVAQPPGAVDGSGYAGPDPPTAPLPVPALNVGPSANLLTQPAW